MCVRSFQNVVVTQPLVPIQYAPLTLFRANHTCHNSAPSFDSVYQKYMDQNGSVSKDEIHFNDKTISLMGEKGISRQELLSDPKSFLQTLSADELIALHSINGVPIPCEFSSENPEEISITDPLLQVESYSEEGCINLLSLESEMVDINKDGDAVYGYDQYKTIFPPENAPGSIKQAWNDTINESCHGVTSFIQNSFSYYEYRFPTPAPVMAVPVAYGPVVYSAAPYSPVVYSSMPQLYSVSPMVTLSSFSAATEQFVENHQGENSEEGDLALRLLKRLEEIIANFDPPAGNDEVV